MMSNKSGAMAAKRHSWRSRSDEETIRLERVDPIDLVGEERYPYWPVGDQRPRQTCVAFAVTACAELLRAGKGTEFTPLSAQYLYWHMRRRAWPGPLPPGWAEGATKLGYAREILAANGICRRELCPYVAPLPPGAPLEGAEPSRTAEREAEQNRITDSCYLDLPPTEPARRPPGVALLVYEMLAQGRPVAIALPKFPLLPGSSLTNWDNPTSFASGEVLDPIPDSIAHKHAHEPDMPGHAFCVVGFQPDAAEATGGWFIFRNSVGIDWAYAIDPEKPAPPYVPARGYGAISASYIERFAWEVMSLALP